MSITPRLSVLLRRLRLRLEEVFDHAWAVMPSQPVVTLGFFLGTMAVVLVDGLPIAFEVLGVGDWVFMAWCFLGLVGPMILAVSHRLIVHSRHRRRLFGFYLRTAADVMQFLALSAYLAARLTLPQDDATIYGLVLLGSLWTLQALWVLRDIWALILIERTATRLHLIVYGR